MNAFSLQYISIYLYLFNASPVRVCVCVCVYPRLKIENACRTMPVSVSRHRQRTCQRPAWQPARPTSSRATAQPGRSDGRRRLGRGCTGTARATSRRRAAVPGRSRRVPAVPARARCPHEGHAGQNHGVVDDTKWAHGSMTHANERSNGRGRGRKDGRTPHGTRRPRADENLCHAPRPFRVGSPYATPRPRAPVFLESPARKYIFQKNRVPSCLRVLSCAIMFAPWQK